MYHVKLRNSNRDRRKLGIRKRLVAATSRPRLTIFRSNKYIYGQLIDDAVGNTLISTSFSEIKKIHEKNNKVKSAFELGKEFAAKAVARGITKIVFDRNGYIYHGRVKSFADGAREGGLQF